MTASLVSRSPTCLACLRRLAQPFGSNNGTVSTASLVQTRAKSNRLQPRDQGVVVRLLEDIPKFGRKASIFRVERGRMRNEWYPRKKAEYMTAARFRELGLSRNDIGDRDAAFGTLAAAELEDIQAQAAPAPKPASKPISATPEQAHDFLTTLIPETLTFHRKPIPVPAPPPAPESRHVSPLVAAPSAPTEPAHNPSGPLAIFGSVSTTDIVTHVKGLLVADAQASRMVLEPEQIRFLGLEEDTDRIKVLGRWEIEIALGNMLEPVRKVVEVLPLEDAQSEAS
ncbi:Ribosomal protein L9 domain-containing protein [Madurella fahalii]|uniref:Ribosomal protein L9 domain-containing protein n=1 Tax=Madurella fahalii TaxID=1157608 RepID=A0ABQ0G0V5_9PEZI